MNDINVRSWIDASLWWARLALPEWIIRLEKLSGLSHEMPILSQRCTKMTDIQMESAYFLPVVVPIHDVPIWRNWILFCSEGPEFVLLDLKRKIFRYHVTPGNQTRRPEKSNFDRGFFSRLLTRWLPPFPSCWPKYRDNTITWPNGKGIGTPIGRYWDSRSGVEGKLIARCPESLRTRSDEERTEEHWWTYVPCTVKLDTLMQQSTKLNFVHP